MEKSAHYFIVGLFVLASVAALTGFLIWLASPREEKDYAYYTVYFTDSVAGLEEGSGVSYKGVKAGKVMKIRLSRSHSDLVRVDIGVDRETPVYAGTQIALEMQGVTGLVFLDMRTPHGERRPPPAVAGEPYPVLHGSGTKIAKVLQGLPGVAGQVTSAAGEAKDTARAVRGLAEKLQANPSQLLYPPSAQGVEIAP